MEATDGNGSFLRFLTYMIASSRGASSVKPSDYTVFRPCCGRDYVRLRSKPVLVFTFVSGRDKKHRRFRRRCGTAWLRGGPLGWMGDGSLIRSNQSRAVRLPAALDGSMMFKLIIMIQRSCSNNCDVIFSVDILT